MALLFESILNIFENFNGKMGLIELKHKIYGTQKTRCVLNLVCDHEKIGFTTESNYIFLYYDEIESVFYERNLLKIVGNLQTITIKIA